MGMSCCPFHIRTAIFHSNIFLKVRSFHTSGPFSFFQQSAILVVFLYLMSYFIYLHSMYIFLASLLLANWVMQLSDFNIAFPGIIMWY
jgi:hypothetical protein